jgi:hypothetical protein
MITTATAVTVTKPPQTKITNPNNPVAAMSISFVQNKKPPSFQDEGGSWCHLDLLLKTNIGEKLAVTASVTL